MQQHERFWSDLDCKRRSRQYGSLDGILACQNKDIYGKNLKIKFLILTISIIAILIGCAKANERSKKITREEIEKQIKKQLTIGVDRDVVTEFLDKNKVEHSESTSKNDVIYAIYRNIEDGSFFIDKSIKVTFYFKNNKLNSYIIKYVRTGP